MHARALRRAAALGATASLLVLSVAVADTLPADGDNVTPDVQDFFEIGPVGTGGTVEADVWFDLVCNTGTHVDPGQTVVVSFGAPDLPDGGAASGGGTTIGPVPASWPHDGSLCPAGTASLRSATPAHVTLTAPDVPGDFEYIINFSWSLSPDGGDDPLAIRGPTRVFFDLTVVPDAAPTLVLPSMLTVEGNMAGGATVSYAVSASDVEDDPDPVPTCAPASGSFFAIGSTDVGCSVKDSAGHQSNGTFEVSVVDTTAPVLAGVPTSVNQSTTDPTGTAASYVLPSATDVVDTAPSVSCSPAPGDHVAVGTTTVVCTAEDDFDNSARASFPLTVALTQTAVLTARFDPPVGPTLVVNASSGRNVPVKVEIFKDGVSVTSGVVDLVSGPCGGAPTGAPQRLARQGDRWRIGLDTAGMTGCVTATVRLAGVAAGSFELRFGDAAAKTGHGSAKKLVHLTRHVLHPQAHPSQPKAQPVAHPKVHPATLKLQPCTGRRH